VRDHEFTAEAPCGRAGGFGTPFSLPERPAPTARFDFGPKSPSPRMSAAARKALGAARLKGGSLGHSQTSEIPRLRTAIGFRRSPRPQTNKKNRPHILRLSASSPAAIRLAAYFSADRRRAESPATEHSKGLVHPDRRESPDAAARSPGFFLLGRGRPAKGPPGGVRQLFSESFGGHELG